MTSFRNLDIATEDDEEEEIQLTQLKEKYYDTTTHPYYDSPKVSQYHHVKPLVLFSLDITHWPAYLQAIFLIGGLILFMCLYGYYQELVQYGWFNRKLSLFSTFLHFLGCFGFAQLQRSLSSSPSNENNNLSNQQLRIPQGMMEKVMFCLYSYSRPNISMGNTSTRTALTFYVLLVVTKTAAQGLSNLSMTQINYPAKVLFKSLNPVVTIVLGLFWFGKSYPFRDYLVVGLLITGLYVFITDSDEANGNSPECTALGIFYVILSLIGSALGPMIQEYCIESYHATIDDLLYYTFLGSTLLSLMLSILNGEFIQGVSFLLNNSSVSVWFIFISFCTVGFIGANFSTAITAHYGSLVNGLSNTLRKALTICVSFIMFPERNILTNHKIVGGAIFFAGLLVSTFWGGEENDHHSSTSVVSNGTHPSLSAKDSEYSLIHLRDDSNRKTEGSSSSPSPSSPWLWKNPFTMMTMMNNTITATGLVSRNSSSQLEETSNQKLRSRMTVNYRSRSSSNDNMMNSDSSDAAVIDYELKPIRPISPHYHNQQRKPSGKVPLQHHYHHHHHYYSSPSMNQNNTTKNNSNSPQMVSEDGVPLLSSGTTGSAELLV